MFVDVLLGLQWGDEGKGKIVDFLANKYDIIARFQGGSNAGHTLYHKGEKIVLHNIPSGVFHDRPINLIGNGLVVDPITFKNEVAAIEKTGVDIRKKLYLARKAHLTLPTHKMLDKASELAKGKAKIGSTLKGIGPTYMDKIGRNGLRIGDIELPNFQEYYETLKAKHHRMLSKYYDFEYDITELEQEWMEAIELMRSFTLVDCEYFVNEQLEAGKCILAEGAQGSMLDIDFGTYPFVTSSNTVSAGVSSGLGVSPRKIREVMGITKAYCTRVGSGPFPTELTGKMGEQIRQAGGEFGATTGRPRSCGWIDLPALRYAIMISGVTQVIMTKVDILSMFGEIQACTHYKVDGKTSRNLPYDMARQIVEPVYTAYKGWECDLEDYNYFGELPDALTNYVQAMEAELGVEIVLLSTGPERNQLVHKQAEALIA